MKNYAVNTLESRTFINYFFLYILWSGVKHSGPCAKHEFIEKNINNFFTI